MEQQLLDQVLGFNIYDITTNHIYPIEGLSVQYFDSSYQFTPKLHRHHFFEVFICLEGKGIHVVDFTEFSIHKNTVYCIQPGLLHHIKMKPPYRGFFVMFHLELLTKYAPLCRPDRMHSFLSKTSFHSKIKNSDTILALVNDMFTVQSASESSHKEALCTSLLAALLHHIEQDCPKDPLFTQTTSLSTQFLSLLSNLIPPYPNVRDYSKGLHVNENYLNNCVKKETGRTAGSWIQEYRLLEAKRLLAHTDNTLETIAELLHFSSASAFCRFFKSMSHITPTAFRVQKNQDH